MSLDEIHDAALVLEEALRQATPGGFGQRLAGLVAQLAAEQEVFELWTRSEIDRLESRMERRDAR